MILLLRVMHYVIYHITYCILYIIVYIILHITGYTLENPSHLFH